MHRYLIAAIGSYLALSLLYVGVFVWQGGAPLRAEYWLRDAIAIKRKAAEDVAARKLLLVGGSSGLFGLRAVELGRVVQLNAINECTHAGLPLSWHLDNARQVLKRGDVVLLHLEYEYYGSCDDVIDEWYVSQLLTWMWPEYVKMSVADQARVLFHVPPSRVFAGAFARCARRAISRNYPYRVSPASYAYTDVLCIDNIDERGDLKMIPQSPISSLPSDVKYAVPCGTTGRRSDRIRLLLEFIDWCGLNTNRVLVCWPPTIRESLDGVSATERAYLADVSQVLAGRGAVLLGAPSDFSYPRTLFYNTLYHLNARGREVHSANVAERIHRAVYCSHVPTEGTQDSPKRFLLLASQPLPRKDRENRRASGECVAAKAEISRRTRVIVSENM